VSILGGDEAAANGEEFADRHLDVFSVALLACGKREWGGILEPGFAAGIPHGRRRCMQRPPWRSAVTYNSCAFAGSFSRARQSVQLEPAREEQDRTFRDGEK
jgi:hypothetical protein